MDKRSCERHQLSFKGDRAQSKTEQHHKKEVDINQIISKYTKAGIPLPIDTSSNVADFTDATDYHTIHNRMLEAQAIFDGLSAVQRRAFNNDLGSFLSFMGNIDENLQEAAELGLITASELSQQVNMNVSPAPQKAEGEPIPVDPVEKEKIPAE